MYEWREGSKMGGDAAAIGATLERMTELTAEAVVAEAKMEDSPLHDLFEWDDTLAANAYRLDQARHLVRSLVIVREGDGPQNIRAFIHVDSKDAYISTTIALSDDEMRQQVLAKAKGELASWRRRYNDLSELARVFLAADLILKGDAA